MSKNSASKNAIFVVFCLVFFAGLLWLAFVDANLTLEDQSRILGIATGFATLIALATGGYWSYQLFVKRRISFPRLNIEYELVCIRLSDGKAIVKVFTILKNVGDMAVHLTSWKLLAEQVLPLPQKAAQVIKKRTVISERVPIWRAITVEREEVLKDDDFEKFIEPGETDRAIANIVIPRDIYVAQIYSHFKSDHPSEPLGWPMQTIVDLRMCDSANVYGKELSMPGSKVWYLKEGSEGDDAAIKQEQEREPDRTEQSGGSENASEDFQETERPTDREDE